MTEQENKKLIEEFSFLQISYLEEDLKYSKTWLDELPKGWNKAFGRALCEELKTILEKVNKLDQYRILEIKEKFGCLRWYDNCDNPEVAEVIHKYEQQARDICYVCGAPAKYDSIGYPTPFCEACALDKLAKDNEIYKKIYEAGDNLDEFSPGTLGSCFVVHETLENFYY